MKVITSTLNFKGNTRTHSRISAYCTRANAKLRENARYREIQRVISELLLLSRPTLHLAVHLKVHLDETISRNTHIARSDWESHSFELNTIIAEHCCEPDGMTILGQLMSDQSQDSADAVGGEDNRTIISIPPIHTNHMHTRCSFGSALIHLNAINHMWVNGDGAIVCKSGARRIGTVDWWRASNMVA